MRYCLTDADRDPPGAERHWVEELVRVSGGCQAYDPGEDGPDVGRQSLHASDGVMFGCLNNPMKITAQMIEVWAHILSKAPASRLALLSAPGGGAIPRIEKELDGRGVKQDRVEWVPRGTRQTYLDHYHRIDVGLDTFPYNGHTTTLDALWMGVPTVTLAGETHLTREGLAVLAAVGLSELAAATPALYIEAAVRLAGDSHGLSRLRRELRERMRRSPLMDGPGLARRLEQAYRWMWQRWCDRR